MMKNLFVKRNIFVCVTASILYGLLNIISGKINLPGSTFIELRPQIIIPLSIGFLYGPFWGFLTGIGGDQLGYYFQGFPLFHAWNWSLCNGFMGMTTGFYFLKKGSSVKTLSDFQFLFFLILASCSYPILFAGLMDIFIKNVSVSNSFYTLIFPAIITDSIFGLLFIPIVLLLFKRIYSSVSSRTMLTVLYLLVLSILMIYGVGTWTVWTGRGKPDINLYNFYNVGLLSLIIIILGLTVSSVLIEKIIQPIIILVEAAQEVSEGNYFFSGAFIKMTQANDEIGRLAAVFKEMALKVMFREKELKKEVSELKIIIEEKENNEEIHRITNSEYFKKLKIKTNELKGNQ